MTNPRSQERHRHRFEFVNAYREVLQAAGMRFSGLSPDGRLVEIAELSDHPFMLGTQFHPEFLSRPNRPHPLFVAFVAGHPEKRLTTKDRSLIHSESPPAFGRKPRATPPAAGRRWQTSGGRSVPGSNSPGRG